jgi:glycosyltransferase involved in cell wall biosynthesis
MRIAQVSPLYESVPPSDYGGTERVVSYLTEALVQEGHDVTLFASGDSVTSAELVAACPRALRPDPQCTDPLAYHLIQLDQVYSRAAEFDVIHFHVDYLHFPFSARNPAPHVTTLHGRLDLPDLPAIYRQFSDVPLISISNDQQKPLPFANWLGTVYHGLPKDLYSVSEEPGSYLAFLGRISPEKRPDWAIEIATRAGVPLKIAAKVDTSDEAYFSERIQPLLNHPLVEYVGEIGESEKAPLLRGARALLFPIDWPEPFGLVMIEAMACGTPVIAFPNGSVPEIIDHEVTGLIVDSVESAVDAVGKVQTISRRGCRERFESRFTDLRMAREYVEMYKRVVPKRPEAGSRDDRAA